MNSQARKDYIEGLADWHTEQAAHLHDQANKLNQNCSITNRRHKTLKFKARQHKNSAQALRIIGPLMDEHEAGSHYCQVILDHNGVTEFVGIDIKNLHNNIKKAQAAIESLPVKGGDDG